jgi:DNA-binding GntR family transcriptional regulator
MPADAPAPLTRTSLAEQVRERLREAIVCGDLPQGGLITEPVVAARYAVSRAPVREALLALERDGLVTFDARGRARVLELTPRVFEELVAVRVSLEGLAARLAAAGDVAELAAALEDNIRRQGDAGTYRDLTRLDVDFHELVVRAARNDRLLAAWLTARSVFEFWLAAAFRDAELSVAPRTLAVDSHRRLLRAVASGDPDRAEKAAVAHITRWRTYLPAARPAPAAHEAAR